MPKVYFDTNILKFSATELRRLVPKETEPLLWGGKIVIDSPVYDITTINPNDNIKNEQLKFEAELLPQVAEEAKTGSINLVINHETLLESWGIPNMDSLSGKFYGAPFNMIEGPFEYSRIVLGHNIDAEEAQYDFLRSISDTRFTEIQKATGAYQGNNPPNKNQLLDAWHLWCAEHSNCDYFLTMDFKLIRMINNKANWNSSVSLVKPSELLDAI